MAENCPTMQNILKADECLENLAGISSDVYVGIKSDLAAPLTPQQDPRKGYDLDITVVIESLNQTFSKVGRALNNLDLFFIVDDGDDSLIMYDPQRRCEADSGGIEGDTGDTADSDRQATCNFHLKPVKYPLLYVERPVSGGWDGLMAD